jgi:hypothetical protein
MSRPIVFIKISYSFIALHLLCCFATEYCYGQLLTTDNNRLQFLYEIGVYLPGSQTVKAIIDTTTNIDGYPVQTFTIQEPYQTKYDSEALTTSNNNDITEALFDKETDILVNKFAIMLELEPDEIENLHLYKFLNEWYGVKYKYGGTNTSGIDCSAFSQKLYGSIYSINILRTSRQQHRHCEIIRKYDDATEGDLVFFRIHRLRISHVGVYLANGYFVHASRSRGVMISSLNDKYWSRRYAGCGRIERESKDSAESDFLQ